MRLEDLYVDAPERREYLIERFWSKVGIREENECWEWEASVTHGGYGRIGIDNQRYSLAHRVSYMLFYVEVPDELCICHVCDNPPCCNPLHLWVGTRVENNEDRDAKGRYGRSDTSGVRNGRSKLSEESVKEIRRLRQSGQTTVALGKRFGVSHKSISNIALGNTWKGVA